MRGRAKQALDVGEAVDAITTLTTKLGGQPVWLNAPQWPLSRQLGEPMRFLAQVRLADARAPGLPDGDAMAYVFMTDGEEYVDGTWESDGGENALVLQRSDGVGVELPSVELVERGTGPTARIWRRHVQPPMLEEAEFEVVLYAGEDPSPLNEAELRALPAAERAAYREAVAGSKVGGTPSWVQGDAWPDDDRSWSLVLQLDAGAMPFEVNFGDLGVGYAFVDPKATKGRFFWQA